MAKMILGTRKKVHHARQNQEAFWNKGWGFSSVELGSDFFPCHMGPQAPRPPLLSVLRAEWVG